MRGGERLSARMQLDLAVVLGFCSCSIAINPIIKAANMTLVVSIVILGTLLDEGLDLERCITALFRRAMHHMPHDPATFDMERFVMVVVFCCASVFAIYGVLVEGMSGDPSILLSKAALDFCTAAIFAVTLGVAVALMAFPMALVLGIVYLAAGALYAGYVSGLRGGRRCSHLGGGPVGQWHQKNSPSST